MEETRKFLRFLTPGFVFAVEIFLMVWILQPGLINSLVWTLKTDNGWGLAISAILASGGIGALFSGIHHFFLWLLPWYGDDFRPLIQDLLERGIISRGEIQSKSAEGWLTDKTKKCVWWTLRNLTGESRRRRDAWVILTGLWHENINDSPQIRGANPRTDSLADIVHSTGSTLIATCLSLPVALAVATQRLGLKEAIKYPWRDGLVILLWLILIFIHWKSFRWTAGLARGTVEHVLSNALIMKKRNTLRQ